jgi:hypothetical protein
MLNYLFMTLGSGSSPDPNIYYRTIQFRSFVRFTFRGIFWIMNMLLFDQEGEYMRKLFTLKTDSLLMVDADGRFFPSNISRLSGHSGR